MRFRAWLWSALLGASVAGCATQAKFEGILNSFMAEPEDALISQWGPPQSSYPLNDGSKVLQYNRTGQSYIPGYQQTTTTFVGRQAFSNTTGSPGFVMQQSCTVNFTVNPQGTLTRWSWQGNACKAR
jgi:hypothetical protein